ncbi:MotA/TolQ/ExbB proton channel family protein [Mariprofundus sp. NF]|uniref:MotA/TolQ/ExbB proton channel family protein n=1 Tax=Mariprofundus sp. NF TaxID=2608716 RepID=UPI0015A3C5CA|nr:MotA/TolQ/ExbB proton channel family protein [Mariprofundus sp. NF]NWF39156.1 MotA/TolQ/ExbB proton channel family protein [Mariprofundus sp. NF]
MSEMMKSLTALIVSAISVHLAYIGFIRPQADMIIDAAKQAGQSAPRDMLVILKDYEQEICIILMLWAGFLIISKCLAILKNQYLFSVDLLENGEESGGELKTVLSNLERLPAEISSTPLVIALMASLRRYLITSDVQNTSDAVESSIEALAIRHDAENSMIRYLIWAIPSIGFIGTVRGIGGALAQADQALAGDIAGMTNSLGLAFNSTFVALLISILLMFLLHQLLRLQDGLVVDTQAYCEKFLLKRISEK